MTMEENESHQTPASSPKRSTAITVVLIFAVTMVLICLLLIGGCATVFWLRFNTVRENMQAENALRVRDIKESELQQAEQEINAAQAATARAEDALRAERLERRQRSVAILSPNQGGRAFVSVNTDKSDMNDYLCLKVHIEVPRDSSAQVFQSRATVLQPWALGWHENDTVILQSSDVGTLAWQRDEKGNWQKLSYPLPEALLERGRDLFRESMHLPASE